MERWFGAAQQAFGFDNDLGRKLHHMFKQLGLTDVKANGFGGDPERRWNWQQQFNSAMPFTVNVLATKPWRATIQSVR